MRYWLFHPFKARWWKSFFLDIILADQMKMFCHRGNCVTNRKEKIHGPYL